MASNIISFEIEKSSWIDESAKDKISQKQVFQSEVLIGGIEIIEKIFADWTTLCEEGASNNPFLRPEWFTAFVKNFESEIMLLTVRREEKLRAVLPLVLK